jgi:hypothetical protein
LQARTVRAQEDNMNDNLPENITVEPEVKTYTQEELDKIVQAEADRRTTKGLETARTKWEQEYQAKIEREKELAKLSEKERLAKELEEKEKALSMRDKELVQKVLLFEAKQDLVDKGLPATFAEFLIKENAETTLDNINKFREHFQSEVEKLVDSRIKGTAPKKGEQISEREELEKQLKDPKVKLEERMMIKRKLEGLT